MSFRPPSPSFTKGKGGLFAAFLLLAVLSSAPNLYARPIIKPEGAEGAETEPAGRNEALEPDGSREKTQDSQKKEPEKTTSLSQDQVLATGSTVIRESPMLAPSLRLGPSQWEDKAITDLPELLRRVPGLHLPRMGGQGSYSAASIRGGSPEQVLVTFNGIPLSAADGSPADLSTLPLSALSSVSIYKGQSPYAFGRLGSSGSIALESPSDATLHRAAIGVGSFNTRSLEAQISQNGTTFLLDHHGTSGNYRFLDDRGTAWNPDDDRWQNRQNAGSLSTHLMGSHHETLGSWELQFLYLYSYLDRGLPGFGNAQSQKSKFRSHRHLGSIELKGTLGPVSARLLTSLAFADMLVSDPLLELGLSALQRPSDSLVPEALLNLSLPLSDFSLQTHLSGRYERYNTPLLTMERGVSTAALELMGPLSFLRLSLGGVALLSQEHQDWGAYLKASAPLPHLLLHASLSRQSRLPSLFERHGDAGLILGNPNLKPENMWRAQLGADTAFDWDALRAHAGLELHASLAQDLIQFVPNAQGISRPGNIAKARLMGLDLSLGGDYRDRLFLDASLSFLDAKDLGPMPARMGKRLPLRPRFTSSQKLSWREPIRQLKGHISAYIEVLFVEGNHLDHANLVKTQNRLLLNAGLVLKSQHISVKLQLENLSQSQVVDLSGYPLPGLSAFLSLEWQNEP